MKKMLWLSVAIVILVAVGMLLYHPSAVVKASSGSVACVGGPCYAPPTPPTCLAGGTMPNPNGFFTGSGQQGHSIATGVQGYAVVGGISGCNVYLSHIDASLSGTAAAAVPVAVYSYTGGSCPTSMTGASMQYETVLTVNSSMPTDHLVTSNEGVLTGSPISGADLCIMFSGGVSGDIETVNVTGFWE
jgi:hypothetical protein